MKFTSCLLIITFFLAACRESPETPEISQNIPANTGNKAHDQLAGLSESEQMATFSKPSKLEFYYETAALEWRFAKAQHIAFLTAALNSVSRFAGLRWAWVR